MLNDQFTSARFFGRTGDDKDFQIAKGSPKANTDWKLGANNSTDTRDVPDSFFPSTFASVPLNNIVAVLDFGRCREPRLALNEPYGDFR